MDAHKTVTATFMRATKDETARMSGEGALDANTGRVKFQFAIRERGDGQVEVEVDGRRNTRFQSTSVSRVTFTDDPSFAPGGRARADSVVFAGEGRYNGRAGFTYEVQATDQGEPGRNDTFIIVIRDGTGRVVESVGGSLRSGNNQAAIDR